MDIVSEVKKRLPNTPLVMHGSSSVPANLIDEVNKYGGDLQKTMGVPIDSIKEAIKRGIKKINVDTDGRLAITGAIRRYFAQHPEVFDPRDYFGEARKAVYETVKSKMIDFGTAGHSGDYVVKSLMEMKKYYDK